jgi:multiple sugar transport system substrate-binding protein
LAAREARLAAQGRVWQARGHRGARRRPAVTGTAGTPEGVLLWATTARVFFLFMIKNLLHYFQKPAIISYQFIRGMTGISAFMEAKMKTGKILSIGLAMLLGVAMLAAAAGSSAPAPAPAGGGVTTFRGWANDAHNKTEFDELVAAFNSGVGAQKGIRVEYTVYGADWQAAGQMALDTGREPEIFKGVTGMQDYQAAGKLLAWTEIPGIETILKNQEPYHRKNATMFNGVPYSVGLYGWYSGFHYNKSLLQRAGFSAPPKTWAEFETQAIAISKLEPGKIYGYAMPLVWSPDFTTWMTEFTATNSIGHMYWNYTEGRFQIADFTPYFELLSRIRDGGAMFPGMESLSDDQQRAQFAAGNIGFIGGAGWNVGVLYEQFPFQPLDGWDYAPLPVRDPNNTYAVPISAGASYYVSAQVKNDRDKLNKIAEVLKLFVGDETQMLMFTRGKHVPLRADIAARAAPGERPQYTTYGKVADRLVTMPVSPIDRLAPEGGDRVAVIGQILTGQIPVSGIRAALTDLDRRYNAAFEQAVTRNQLKREDYIDSTFEARLRAR